jgi:hypothetical protein
MSRDYEIPVSKLLCVFMGVALAYLWLSSEKLLKLFKLKRGEMRDTSLTVYDKIKKEALLGRLQFIVYEMLYTYGPMTQMELSRMLPAMDRSQLGPRFSELKRLGCVREVSNRGCSITGTVVSAWDVTSRLPDRSVKRKKNEKAELQATIKRIQGLLEFSIEDLKKQREAGRKLTQEESLWLLLAEREVDSPE